ncbi:MAG: single-stranded-DNA-specific exonuclease RecJ [Janthinobacterium lividum]
MSAGQTRPGSWSASADTVDSAGTSALASALSLPVPLAALLLCRGLTTPAAGLAFLQPKAEHLHDPASMLGLGIAVDRLRAALLAHQPILIYGDYDVDGTVATVLLKTALDRAAVSLGVAADVRYHIPHRIREGYGMRESRLADAALEGVRLVVSVDTGIRAFAAATEAARLGLDLIVTDHHLPDGSGVPQALAVLNPNQPGCPYPCKDLCGAAVAFKLAQALLEGSARDAKELQNLRDKTLPSFLKLLAIATISDAVPLTGENRVIAALGLQALRQPAQSGLRTLMELAGIDLSRPVSATDVGFRIGPRINAAGRMDVASDVVEMFLTRDSATARALAEKLHKLNDDRRATEASALADIEARLEELAASKEGMANCLVLEDTATARWHRGVVGILASRVVDRTGRPALVLTHENGEAHGSGRSVAGFHLLDALTEAHAEGATALFSRFGGHAHAAGFALPSTHVAELRERLERLSADLDLSAFGGGPVCDAQLPFGDLTPAFFSAYQLFEPFGNGNPEPIFLTRNLRLAAPLRVLADRHLALQVEDPETGRRFRATAWTRRIDWLARSRDNAWAPGMTFDLAFRLRRNWHPDFGGWELEVVDLLETP